MINYVNNAYDKVLKPCDAQQFMILTQSEQTARLILAHRSGDPKAKSKLPALTYMGVLDAEKYRKYLDGCKAQGIKPQGSRRAEFMRPTGLLMLDFDHISNPQALYEQLASKIDKARLALAHITPSGDGLRVVLKRTKGKSIEQEQYEFGKAMDVKCDDVCKDISRLSFAPMQREVLYYNPSLLFGELPEAEDYPDGSLFSGVKESRSEGVQTNASTDESRLSSETKFDARTFRSLAQRGKARGQSQLQSEAKTPELPNSPRTFETEYNGVSYSEIVQRLEEQLGGRPEHGARNSFIFTMACNLRYVCNDDPAWIASILPTYGEDPQKHRMTVQSAVNRPMSRSMPETMARALGVAKGYADNNGQTTDNSRSAVPPTLPERLPEPIALLVSRTPEAMRAAVAMAVFPALGAHLYETEFVYIDNRCYEATFMHLLVAELSSGKSAVNMPLEHIIADMRERDEVARNREREWREECSVLGNAKDRPKRPSGLGVQVLTADMTNAAFVQRLADAKGRFLYTMMDEVELLDALKTNGRAGAVSQILRLAFDRGIYGQERVAATAVNEQVRVRWNWNASTTVQRGRNYFRRSIADGTLSRLSFATILTNSDDWGDEIPVYGTYDTAFAESLRPYIDALNVCRGTLRCNEAEEWARRILKEQIDQARQTDDRPYAKLAYRAVLMGFLRGMVLYVMNGMQWNDEIGEFAAWTVRYDMWCKMRIFGDLLRQDLEAEATALQQNPRNLLALLPQEFTRQMAQELRMEQGRKPNPKDMLGQWIHRGFIKLDKERNVYVKCV